MVNVPHDRYRNGVGDDGRRTIVTVPGESLSETATRVEKMIDRPPVTVPIVPIELRDPDAPEGWYDEPDQTAAWAAFAAQHGLADQLG